MNYFFYNTGNRPSTLKGRKRDFRILIRKGLAVTGGDPIYGEKLGCLSKGDTLLMYENKIGIVAIGAVRERWDRKTHSDPVYTLDELRREYRLNVNWFLDLSDTPISLEELNRRTGYGAAPRGTVRRIVESRPEFERLIEELQSSAKPLSTCEASDLSVPDRIETTVYRILRDTDLARQVKRMHNFECQICGHTIHLPDRSRYAEAHHIQPLGGEHKGCDDITNIMCVCPNHHAELDYGVIQITLSTLRQAKGHSIASKFVEYHNKKIYNR